MSNTYKDNLKKMRKSGNRNTNAHKAHMSGAGFNMDSMMDLAWSGEIRKPHK